MDPALNRRMDAMAEKLLTAAENTEALDTRIAVFDAIARWLQTKNVSQIESAAGSGIRANQPGQRRGFEHDSPELQRQRALKRWGRRNDQDPEAGDGSGLEALRARCLPRSDGGTSR